MSPPPPSLPAPGPPAHCARRAPKVDPFDRPGAEVEAGWGWVLATPGVRAPVVTERATAVTRPPPPSPPSLLQPSSFHFQSPPPSAGPSYNYYSAPPLIGGYGGFSPFFPGYGYGFGGPALVLGGGGGLFFNLIFFGMVASVILSAFRGGGGGRSNTSEDDEEDDRFY